MKRSKFTRAPHTDIVMSLAMRDYAIKGHLPAATRVIGQVCPFARDEMTILSHFVPIRSLNCYTALCNARIPLGTLRQCIKQLILLAPCIYCPLAYGH